MTTTTYSSTWLVVGTHRAVRSDPWRPVARQLEEHSPTSDRGAWPLVERVITSSRGAAEVSARAEVASEVDDLVRRSGLTSGALAERIGTSASQLSTHRTGWVTLSAAFLVRMRREVGRLN